MHRHCQVETPFDIQHLAYKCLSTVGPSALPVIAAITGDAPRAPNTATDGGTFGHDLSFWHLW